MDEEQPGPDEPFDDDVYVRAWWQRSAYFHGTPEQRDDEAGYALDWAEKGIQRMMLLDDPDGVISLLWRLIKAPEADLAILVECVLQPAIEFRPAELDEPAASMCATYPLFRDAIGRMIVTAEDAANLPELTPYLTRPYLIMG